MNMREEHRQIFKYMVVACCLFGIHPEMGVFLCVLYR